MLRRRPRCRKGRWCPPQPRARSASDDVTDPAELIAACVEALLGSSWGVSTVVSGVLQGLGAEIGFAPAAYASFGIGAAMLAGAIASPMEVVYEWYSYWQDWDWGDKIGYLFILPGVRWRC